MTSRDLQATTGRRVRAVKGPTAATRIRRPAAAIAAAVGLSAGLWWLRPATGLPGADTPPASMAVAARNSTAAAAPVAPAALPDRDVATPADVAPPTSGATASPAPLPVGNGAAASEPRGDTMFLTIIGDQTFVTWGKAGDRPPRFDVTASGATFAAASLAVPRPTVAGGGRVIDDPAMAAAAVLQAETSDPGFRPLGPPPQACPRTLPPGTDQATADALRSQFGCRYLSSCSSESDCSWYYQGRG